MTAHPRREVAWYRPCSTRTLEELIDRCQPPRQDVEKRKSLSSKPRAQTRGPSPRSVLGQARNGRSPLGNTRGQRPPLCRYRTWLDDRVESVLVRADRLTSSPGTQSPQYLHIGARLEES